MSQELILCPSHNGGEDQVYRHGVCCATCRHCTRTGSLCAASGNPKVECLCVEEQDRKNESYLHKLWQPLSPAAMPESTPTVGLTPLQRSDRAEGARP